MKKNIAAVIVRLINLGLSFLLSIILYRTLYTSDYILLSKYQFIGYFFILLFTPINVILLHGKEKVSKELIVILNIFVLVSLPSILSLISSLSRSNYTPFFLTFLSALFFTVYTLIKKISELYMIEFLNKKELLYSQLVNLSYVFLDFLYVLLIYIAFYILLREKIILLFRFFPLIILLILLSIFWERILKFSIISNLRLKFFKKLLNFLNFKYIKELLKNYYSLPLLVHNLFLIIILNSEKFFAPDFLIITKAKAFLLLLTLLNALNSINGLIVDYVRPYLFDHLKNIHFIPFPKKKYIMAIMTMSLLTTFFFVFLLMLKNLGIVQISINNITILFIVLTSFFWNISYLFDIILIGMKLYKFLSIITVIFGLFKILGWMLLYFQKGSFYNKEIFLSLFYFFPVSLMALTVVMFSLITYKNYVKRIKITNMGRIYES